MKKKLPSMKDMPYHIGLVVKIYPDYRQKHLIAVNDGAKRAVYNYLVASGNEIYRLSKTADYVPSDRERIDYLKTTRQSVSGIQNAMPFLYGEEVDAQTVANAIQNYHAAWKNMKEQHRGVPTFKKKSYEQSYQTNAHYRFDKNGDFVSNVQFEDRHHVTLPKLGRIRFDGSPKLIEDLLEKMDNIRIGTIKIFRDAVGEYWASFSLGSEKPFRAQMKKTGRMEGIDLNLIELVNCSDGTAVPNRKFYANSMKKRAKQQHILDRRKERAKKEGRDFRESKGYQGQRVKVAYINRKTARQREDYLHGLSRHEIENQDFIAAEDLKVSNLIKNHRLAKAIQDAGWRMLLTMLQYKAEMYGKQVILIPPQYTTQTCSACGYVLKEGERLTLLDRDWTCPNCHTHHHRDTNAAQVILQKGLEAAGISV